CSNTATNCFGAGIQTQNWNGFAKLNEVSASDVGHLSQANDNGSLLFSRYYENTGPGLKSDDPSSVLDLSGKHSGSVNLAAYDTIDHNNIVGSAASGQIEWNGPRIKLGSINLNTTTFGRNSIIGNNSSDHLMFNSSSGSILIGGISSEGINNNFWGYGAWSSLTTVMLAGNSNGRLTPNISFSPNDPEYGTAPFIDPNTEECGEEFNTTSIIAKNPQSLSIQEYDTDRCNSLYDKGEGLDKEMKYAEAYDTLRLYIELCAMQQFAYFEFNTISGDLYLMGGDSSRFVSGRDWFKKVLYYNPDSNYYCADVIGLLRTFNFFEGRGNDYLGSLAVLKYLNDNHKCLSWYDLKHYDTIYSNTINQVISLWRDSVKDSIKTPLDTTLPSIDELGLGILRGPSRVGASSGPVSETIGNLALVENPFRTEAILRYRLNRGAMVRIDVYDVLGKQMRGEGEGYKHEDDYEFSFDTRSWASGTYFVRVSTMGGEVQTIKAIKK
ncbi:MAG: T9SS type A sorting domain-containing protein, partial [Bacteroidota bacterium]|nr:T9SS type A sorting domain-containing protein [Bacteroidota bacterium]